VLDDFPKAGQVYADDGFVLLRGAVAAGALDALEQRFLGLVETLGGRRFQSSNQPELAAWLAGEREVERGLYAGIRDYPWLAELSSHASITAPVKQLLGSDIGFFEKIPFRIDLPMVVRELAVWHQDHFYVKGNTNIVTAWIPLQDTTYDLGCLMVMPGSHKLGAVAHDKPLLGKKFIPSDPGIYQRAVRYVEMKRRDLLLFNALLLHSSGNNISDRLRLSVQTRFSRVSEPGDPGMGALMRV